MKVEKLVVGFLQTNCYLVWDEKSKETVVIDPGDDGDYIIRRIQDFRLKPKLILVTHGHFDHILAVPEIKLAFNIAFMMHKSYLFLLKRSSKTAKYFTGLETDLPLMPDKFIKDGDLIKFGKRILKVIETPGHTPGGISFYYEADLPVVFSGDILFDQGVGRYDFSYSSKKDLFNSIKKIFKLPGKTIIYPGHGREIAILKRKNRHLVC